MSYVSVLKNIPELLSQPAGIAAIASVGIHGAIAFILPLMPVDSKPKEKASPASVGIMELSEAEQNRLPQKKGPQISALPKLSLQPGLTLPKFATQPTPLPKLQGSPDSTKVILPPLPNSSGNPNISSLPKGQALPILPQPNFNSSFNAKAQSGGSYRRFNQNIKLGNPTPLVSKRKPSSRNTIARRIENIPPVQSAPLPAELRGMPAPPPISNSGLSAGNSVAINPTINNSVPVNQPRRISPEEFIAPTNRNMPKPGDRLTFAGQNVQQWGQQSAPRRIELPTQPANNRSTISQPQNSKLSPQNKTTNLALARQFSEVQQRYPNIETKEPISDVIKTKPGKEGKVEGTLVIDSDGKADYLKFVDRSVSSKLKKETRNYFRRYFKDNPIRKNGKAKVYAFALDFKSDPVNSVEFSKPESKLVDRLRSNKDGEIRLNQKPSEKKPGNVSRSSTPIKLNTQPSSGAVVVPSNSSTPVKIKPQIRVEPNKPSAQSTPKPSLANRLRSIEKESDSDNDLKQNSSSKKLIERLRKIQKSRENSN